MNFIISDIVRVLCLSFIIFQCHQRKLSKKRRSKCRYKCFYCVLCEVRAYTYIASVSYRRQTEKNIYTGQ